MGSMKVDSTDANNCSEPGTNKNGLDLYPVSGCDSGEGLPYAPVNWPNPGDKWSWGVGRRITPSGHFRDRYLFLPNRLTEGGHRKYRFQSRNAVEQYLRSKFPNADLNAFFASFSWKIPSKEQPKATGDKDVRAPSGATVKRIGTIYKLGTVYCKAGNPRCSSLKEVENAAAKLMSCDICCSEPGFCQHCCCILCSRTISSAFDGTYIRCEATVDGGYICGHMAHINCAFQAYMVGTIGGTIGLDAEYYCRRCDSRTDLVSHVMKLVQSCQTSDSQDEIEKILNVGIRLLQGSLRASAEQLLYHIKIAMAKLKKETDLEVFWRKDDISVANGGLSDNKNNTMGSFTPGDSLYNRTSSSRPLSLEFDHRVESLKLEDEIGQVLQSLRKSQEYEYRVAEESLLVQKNHIQYLHEQLGKDSLELSRPVTDSDDWCCAFLKRVEQIKREVVKLNHMKEVAKGLGRTSNHVLKEHFGLGAECG